LLLLTGGSKQAASNECELSCSIRMVVVEHHTKKKHHLMMMETINNNDNT